MKKLLAIALCALFAIHAAEARTIYVNANRPNNKGNGLKVKTAKKTIQAAINIAKKGDTILVYPGTYAPIKTNNKKITIKSVKGRKKTKIVRPDKAGKDKYGNPRGIALAQLGKPYKLTGAYSGANVTGEPWTTGWKTTLYGFLIDGKDNTSPFSWLLGVSGGTVKSCTLQRIGNDGGYGEDCVVANSWLVGCTVKNNKSAIAGADGNPHKAVGNTAFSRCLIKDNSGYFNCGFNGEKLTLENCLISRNKFCGFDGATLLNCTIVGNTANEYLEMSDSDAKGGTYGNFARWSSFTNCILWDNYYVPRGKVKQVLGYYYSHESMPGFGYYYRASGETKFRYVPSDDDTAFTWVANADGEEEWVELTEEILEEYYPGYRMERYCEYYPGTKVPCNKDASSDGHNVYKNCYTKKPNPKFANAAKGNYKLKKGSSCIDKGKLTTAQKKLVGTKDLAGKRRIRGKAVDLGCYEY
jgi:hypothetical protein